MNNTLAKARKESKSIDYSKTNVVAVKAIALNQISPRIRMIPEESNGQLDESRMTLPDIKHGS